MASGDRAYLLADMHLKPLDAPSQTVRRLAETENRRLAAFLAEISGQASRLILLGDAFNFWFERRSRVAGDYSEALRLFRAAAERGLEIHHVSGNRDYAVGGGLGFDPAARYPGFLRLRRGFTVSRLVDYGIEPHGPRYRFHQAGKTVACLHGDSLCSGDRPFMALRWLLQGPLGRFALRWAPWAALKPVVAWQQARLSIRAASRTPDRLFSPAALVKELSRGAELVVCGHAHARLTREVEFSGRRRRLEAIPAWQDGWYGVLENGEARAERFANG